MIHITGVSAILLAELLGTSVVSLMILFMTILYVVSEHLRLRGKGLLIITRITKLAAREHETSGWILRPLSYAFGMLIALNLFPEPFNYASVCILTIGDGFSSLIGMRYGRHTIPFNREKTIEGSFTFLSASLVTTSFFVYPLVALLGSIAGTVAESFQTKYLENIIVPTISGLCMSIVFLFK